MQACLGVTLDHLAGTGGACPLTHSAVGCAAPEHPSQARMTSSQTAPAAAPTSGEKHQDVGLESMNGLGPLLRLRWGPRRSTVTGVFMLTPLTDRPGQARHLLCCFYRAGCSCAMQVLLQCKGPASHLESDAFLEEPFADSDAVWSELELST